MRVAVSGTHGSGKTTLIEQFLLVHPDFIHEPEPYLVLEEEYGEVFAAEPSADDFYRQLEFNIERLRRNRLCERVIYERCPIDFLAYLLALKDLRRGGETARLLESALDLVKDAIELLDVIAFLPLDDLDDRVIPDAEDPELRMAVDDHLVSILSDDDLNFFTSGHPAILELRGTTAQRLRTLESIIRADNLETDFRHARKNQ